MELLGLRIYRINSALSGDDKLINMQPNIISPSIKLALGHRTFIIVPARHLGRRLFLLSGFTNHLPEIDTEKSRAIDINDDAKEEITIFLEASL